MNSLCPNHITAINAGKFECLKCEIGKQGNPAIGGEGPVPASLMILGMNPAVSETKQGSPFVGKSGNILNELLESAGIPRADVYITNQVKHITPGLRTPTPDEVEACREYLYEEIEKVDPRIILCLGAAAMVEAFPKMKVGEANGVWRKHNGRLWTATYHPSAIARGNIQYVEPTMKTLKDLKKMMEELKVND